ncbi:hypothetical protein RDWZM_004160 [Blomia tropicalis]|uniref:Uncharacterized protein n=1 Tax=Blomia tropicalis TaxID=40697 RepID=A0A9Q0MGK9_BLOTA|nr:hypothetical protein RDWZM_004160 [Blomia tropicalis]
MENKDENQVKETVSNQTNDSDKMACKDNFGSCASFPCKYSTGGKMDNRQLNYRPDSSSTNSHTSLNSLNSNSSKWSFEAIASANIDANQKVTYSEATIKQAAIIKQLVEEQEKETAELLKCRQKMQLLSHESNNDGGHVDNQIHKETSESFSQAMDWIEEQIRKAKEQLELERRERKLAKAKEKAKQRENNDQIKDVK